MCLERAIAEEEEETRAAFEVVEIGGRCKEPSSPFNIGETIEIEPRCGFEAEGDVIAAQPEFLVVEVYLGNGVELDPEAFGLLDEKLALVVESNPGIETSSALAVLSDGLGEVFVTVGYRFLSNSALGDVEQPFQTSDSFFHHLAANPLGCEFVEGHHFLQLDGHCSEVSKPVFIVGMEAGPVGVFGEEVPKTAKNVIHGVPRGYRGLGSVAEGSQTMRSTVTGLKYMNPEIERSTCDPMLQKLGKMAEDGNLPKDGDVGLVLMVGGETISSNLTSRAMWIDDLPNFPSMTLRYGTAEPPLYLHLANGWRIAINKVDAWRFAPPIES